MSLKFLQVNLGRGKEAQDLMLQKAIEDNTDILLISEQYKNPPHQIWYEDKNQRAAIMVRNRNLIVSNVDERNAGFVYITIGKIRIYSCYFSPSLNYNDFAEALNTLELSIRSAKCKVVIGGDFNSKSPEWHSNVLDKRGTIVSEMIAGIGLTVFNVGDKFTFRGSNGCSIIDITFGTPIFCNEKLNWLVLEDITLSDHQYISFNINECTNIRPMEVVLPRWNTRKRNDEKLAGFITKSKERLTNHPPEIRNVDNEVERLTNTLTKACNISMPKVKRYNNKRPVYWWNNEIRELRMKCLTARRMSTRNPENDILMDDYKLSRKVLRKAIKDSKKRCWSELCQEIDKDPWGKPYKIAMKRLGGIKPIPGIKEATWATKIVETLFPFDEDGLTNAQQFESNNFIPLSIDEIKQAGRKLGIGKSPGPDGIPNEVVKITCELWPEYLTKVFNSCLETGSFPVKWKIQKLVLLQKGNKPLNEPSSYRPLCMLDSLGKLLEYVILSRLEECVENRGGLSPMQYGFRKGKSAIDAISEVCNKALQAKAAGEYCAIITLDVKNAFNTVKWNVVLKAFKNKGVENYLYNIVADYLDERILLYETESGIKKYKITAGVPQGSVLGPFLWNVMYDGLLNLDLPDGAKLIGYADDIALVINQRTAELIEIVANDCLCRCDRWLWRNGLQLAASKTETILVTNRRLFRMPKIRLQATEISFQRNLCYLGVQLDDKFSFKQHALNIRDKAMRTASLLSRIMPNCGGPKSYIRKLINSVVHSQLLYAAPTFANALKCNYIIRELQKPQRASGLRIISGYRTVSTSAALVLAGVPPIDLLILEREEIYLKTKNINWSNYSPTERITKTQEIKKSARENILNKWQERWTQEKNGRWTYKLIPNIRNWIQREHGNMGYYLTQVMTNHGCFNKYLQRFKLREISSCNACGALEEDAEHIVFECEKWLDLRTALNSRLGITLTPENMINTMLLSETAWKHCEGFINKIMKYRCTEIPNLLS